MLGGHEPHRWCWTTAPSTDSGTTPTSSFRPDFRFRRQAEWAAVYVRALLQDGERKSVEPLALRVPLPPVLGVRDPVQAMQNFVNQSTWDEQKVWKRYRLRMSKMFSTPHAIFVIDDTSFPKDGKHSVGVQRQYCGAMGKEGQLPSAVSLHYVGIRGHFPLVMRLYLPESWVGDPARLDEAGVPREYRRMSTKGEIARNSWTRSGAKGLPGHIVVTDAGYGVAQEFRDRQAAGEVSAYAGVRRSLRITGSVLFPPPPSELIGTVSVSISSPVDDIHSVQVVVHLAPLAFQMSPSLSPFAMWPALPPRTTTETP